MFSYTRTEHEIFIYVSCTIPPFMEIKTYYCADNSLPLDRILSYRAAFRDFRTYFKTNFNINFIYA
jgi:hypothetical protein